MKLRSLLLYYEEEGTDRFSLLVVRTVKHWCMGLRLRLYVPALICLFLQLPKNVNEAECLVLCTN